MSPVCDVTSVIGPGLGPRVTVAPDLLRHTAAPGVTVAAADEVLLLLLVPVPRPVEVLLLPPVTPPSQALITRVQWRPLTVIPGITQISSDI